MRKSHGKAARPGRWMPLAGITVAVMLALAACGSVAAQGGAAASGRSPSGTPSTGGAVAGAVPLGAGPALCSGLPKLRSLTITRVVTLHNHLHFPFPAKVALSDPARVQAVAGAACRLPQLPRVMVTCPADLGISYRLDFAAAGRSYPVLTAAATGCAKLAGLDGIRKVVPSFWVTLGRAMGLASPGAAAFGGQPH